MSFFVRASELEMGCGGALNSDFWVKWAVSCFDDADSLRIIFISDGISFLVFRCFQNR